MISHRERCRLAHLSDLHDARFSYKLKDQCSGCQTHYCCVVEKETCRVLNLKHPCKTCLVGPVCKLYTPQSSDFELCQDLLNYVNQKRMYEHKEFLYSVDFKLEHPVKHFFMEIRKAFTNI